MKNKNAIYDFAKRRKLALNKFKEEVGCLNPGCSWDSQYEAELLDFHHLDPDGKVAGIASLRCYGDKLVKEISKCTLLCANCHRLLHNKKLHSSSLPACPEFKLPARPTFGSVVENGYKRSKYSGYRGVTKHKTGKWQALVKGKYLGLFTTELEAAARCAAYCESIERKDVTSSNSASRP